MRKHKKFIRELHSVANYVKIVIDGFFIRSLLLAFFFKVYPEIILQGRLYIAEPPLYRIDDKKDPFVINKKDYINRYMNKASQFYKFGYKTKKDVNYINKNDFAEFLADTSSYVDDMNQIVNHYVVNDRLLEMIYEEFAMMKIDFSKPISDAIKKINIDKLLNRINITFPELYYEDNIIRGSIDAKYQMIEITEHLIRKGKSIIETMMKWLPNEGTILFLKDVKTGTEYELSLLGILKILKKYQPKILHRFKGLGENDEKDLRKCIMDPNTRTLIKVQMSDIENDMKTFQLLRGNNTSDALGRKVLMREYQIDKDEIDT